MPLNWPTPSFIGEQYTYLGNTWVWDGQVWKSLGEYIPGPTGPTGPTGSIGPTGPGGASGSYSYIVSNTTQTNGGTASANLITYDSIIGTSDITQSSGAITFTKDGEYSVQFSGQFNKGTAGAQNVNVWLSLNGTNVPDSRIFQTVSSTTTYGVYSREYLLNINNGDNLSLYWSSTDPAMSILAFAGTTGPDRPAQPSVSVTIHQITSVIAGPTGPTGPTGPGGISLATLAYYNDTAQQATGGIYYPINWQNLDTDNTQGNTGLTFNGTSRYTNTSGATGTYLITGQVGYRLTSNTTSFNEFFISKNGGTAGVNGIYAYSVNDSIQAVQVLSSLIVLGSGDYFEVYGKTSLIPNTYIEIGWTPNLPTRSFANPPLSYGGAGLAADFIVFAGYTGNYYLTLASGGFGYAPTETITILGTDLGGTSPANDIVITILTVDMGGEILTYSFTGTPPAIPSINDPLARIIILSMK